MVSIAIDTHTDTVVFNVEGLDKLWCFRSRLEIPLSHILDVEANTEQVGRWWHGFRLLGAELPGLFAGGTFRYHGETVFWDVRDPSHAVIVTLAHERFKKLIVEVAEPADVVAALRAALRAAAPSAPQSH